MKMGDKKTMSLKQIEANHNNSLKSTGPKTAEGKAIAKMNAAKNGILSGQVVVTGFHYKESRREFRAFRERFWRHYAPVGPVEEMLVDRIVTSYWRLRRAVTAESGEIALSVDNGWWKREHLGIGNMLAWYMTVVDPLSKMEESSQGAIHIQMVLEDVLRDFRKNGELTEEAIQNAIKRFGGKSNVITNELNRLRTVLLNNPDGMQPAELKKSNHEAVESYIERELEKYDDIYETCLKREKKEEEARQAAAVLPSAEKLDKIQRYETTLDRQVHRDMIQLERLQRMRKGETVPPPLTMEVSHK